MKKPLLKLTALLLVIITIVTVVPTVFADTTLVYSKSSNSGERGDICTTLNGTTASGYYTGEYTYASLSALSSSSLLTKLRNKMKAGHKQTSYGDCRDYASKTDCENNDGRINLLYTAVSVTDGDYAGGGSVGWNREHVWPKSLGDFETSGAGADLHHIRPDDYKTNGDRGNLKYGEVSGGSAVNATSAADNALGGYRAGGYFEPLDHAKGDVARICLYVYVRWGGEYSKCSKITGVFESVETLLEWHALDPVDTWEMGRNEVIYGIQGNRNVFIDYPELAFLLFDEEIPSNMTTPSRGAGNTTDTEQKPDPTPDTTKPTPVIPEGPEIDPSAKLLSSKTVSAFTQVKKDSTADALRVIFVGDYLYLTTHKALNVTITFKTAAGEKHYEGRLAKDSDDFTFYHKIMAGSDVYQADTGCLLFGIAIVGIPKDTITLATVTLTDASGNILSKGSLTFD